MKLRRALLAFLSDAAYNAVQSFHSDSAVAFALFLHHLPSLTAPLQPSQLLAAIEVCHLLLGPLWLGPYFGQAVEPCSACIGLRV